MFVVIDSATMNYLSHLCVAVILLGIAISPARNMMHGTVHGCAMDGIGRDALAW